MYVKESYNYNIQAYFLGKVKSRVRRGNGYVEELSDLLKLSRDSIYRRYRGETELTLKEAIVICNHYDMNLQEFIGQDLSGSFIKVKSSENISDWLSCLESVVKPVNTHEGAQLELVTYDIPVFYILNYKYMTAFKLFIWENCYGHDNQRFSCPGPYVEHIDDSTFSRCQKISSQYGLLPTTEIWSVNSLLETISQVKFYAECGYLENHNIIKIMDDIKLLSNNLESNLFEGKKAQGGKLDVYLNYIHLTQNSLIKKSRGFSEVYNFPGQLTIMSGKQKRLVDTFEDLFRNTLRSAIKISETGYRDRQKFLRVIRKNINVEINSPVFS